MATPSVPSPSDESFAIPSTKGRLLAQGAQQKGAGNPGKVADAIIVTLSDVNVDPDTKAGFLRFFTAQELQALQKKIASLKTDQNRDFYAQIFNVAIFSTSDHALKEALVAVKNAFLSTPTSALDVAVSHPVVQTVHGSTEVGMYFGDARKDEKVHYPDRINVESDAALMNETLHVACALSKSLNPLEFITANKDKWAQALDPAKGPINALVTIGKEAREGSLLKGVSATLSRDLMHCREVLLRGADTREESLKTYQKMCGLLREAECVIEAQSKSVDAFPAKKAMMLLKLQNLHTKFDEFLGSKNREKEKKVEALAERLGRFGVHDPELYTERLFSQEELQDINIDTLKDSMDALVDTMKKCMTTAEWTKNTNEVGGRSKPFSALEQELVTDFDTLIRAAARRS